MFRSYLINFEYPRKFRANIWFWIMRGLIFLFPLFFLIGCGPMESGSSAGILTSSLVGKYLQYCNSTEELESAIIQECSTLPGFEDILEIWARPLDDSWVAQGRPLEDLREANIQLLSKCEVRGGGETKIVWYSSGYRSGLFSSDLNGAPELEALTMNFVNVYRRKL